MDDREAIDRLKGGDISGLEALVRRYQLKALRAALLVTRDRELAEDVVQSAFVRAYERIGQFHLERPFGPWFFRSVVNAAAKAAARARREVLLDGGAATESTPLDLVSDPRADPEQLFEQTETREALQAALSRLSPNHRAAIVLRYYLGLSEAEMADQLGNPRGTVKRRLHDARERLKNLLRSSLQPAGQRTGGTDHGS